jgi:hypothetical protein
VRRIPRDLEQVQLGMTRDQVLHVLPSGRAVLKQDMPGGMTVTFNGDPAQDATHVARQLFVRFGPGGRAVELRVRYFDGPAAGKSPTWATELLAAVKRRCGAPDEVPAIWGDVWTDFPPRKQAAAGFRWKDDVTILTCQRDAGAVELSLLDRPRDQEAGVSLPRLEYLVRGPDDCQLGVTRDDLLQRWGVKKPVTAGDGALVLAPKSPQPFDAILVWFEHDRVVRIIGRQAAKTAKSPTPEQMGQALGETWGRDLRRLGWPIRQDFTPHRDLYSLAWLDERTRVRLFWQDNDDGTCRTFTEWKEIPAP